MADTQQGTSTTIYEALSGIAFWVITGVVILVIYFYQRESVEVFLNISTQPELVSGTVAFKGSPVRGGLVHVVIFDARNRQYLAGTTLAVGEDGKFTSHGQSSLGIGKNNAPLGLIAVFRGALVEEAKEAKGRAEVKPLSGESTLYINSPPPLDVWFLWGVIIATLLALVLQLYLFTGSLSARKARWLFVLMYFFTFSSLAMPIAVSLVVAQNKYLVDAIEASPIGLLRAKTKGLSEPQWLINIGGTVVHDAKPAVTTTTGLTPAEEAPNKAGPGGTVADRVPSAAENTNAGRLTATVEGGVAVPFYVVLLAMFGAGINMTLKVPEIQRSYEDVLLNGENNDSLSLNPVTAARRWLRGEGAAGKVIRRKTAGDIRRELIENSMYVLSAPLLAIAMYYLLQVMAEQVTQPVLVLMAFATGLVSRAVVGGIIEFAEDKLLSEKRGQERDAVQRETEGEARAVARGRQREAEEAAQAAEAAAGRRSEAEAAASVADEAALQAKQKQADVEAARTAGKPGVTQADAETAQEEAKEAAQEAHAKQAAARGAAQEAVHAAQEAHVKQAEARVAATVAQVAAVTRAAQEAQAKQAEAHVAVEATKEAAKVATEKQTEAEAAVEAVVTPAQALVEETQERQAEAGVAPDGTKKA
jgi:hypothetical protein